MVKLAVSRLENDAHIWLHQLTAKSTDYELGHLGLNEFKMEIESAFTNMDRELKLKRLLATLILTVSIASYTKEFRRLALKLSKLVLDNSALMFMYVEGLKPAVKIQVLLARPSMLIEAEQIVERADMGILYQGNNIIMDSPDAPTYMIINNPDIINHHSHHQDQFLLLLVLLRDSHKCLLIDHKMVDM